MNNIKAPITLSGLGAFSICLSIKQIVCYIYITPVSSQYKKTQNT